jgi:PAS domain S-box-containing protein
MTNRPKAQAPRGEDCARLEAEVAELTAALTQTSRQLQAEMAARQSLEAERQKSEHNFAALFQASPDAMILSRISDGVIIEVNEATVEQTGYTRDELLGCSTATNELGLWVNLAEREQLLDGLRQTGQVSNQEILVGLKDGSIRRELMSARLIRLEDELCLLTSRRDITERVRAEQARAKAEAALRESEARYRELAEENARLLVQSQGEAAAKAFRLNEVNHRVKNNLAAILGLLQLELSYLRAEDPTPYHAMVQDLSARIQSLLLVHNLLSAAVEAPLPLARLASIVMRVAPAMLPRQQAPVQMEISPLPVPLTPKQANALGLILNELTTNSLKYAAQGSEPIQLRLHVTQANQEVNLVFRDSGPGFPAEVLQGVRPSVGLYLIQNLAESELNGKLELSNDEGAVVRLAFSLANDQDDGPDDSVRLPNLTG